jgi:hypothetical protein
MATFSTVPRGESERLVMPARRATQEQYRQYIRQVSVKDAGQLQLGPDDNSITERARLKAAAKAEGISLHIQRRGNTIVFWGPPNCQSPGPPAAGGGNAGRLVGQLSWRLPF